ncbi:hypothetical protein MSPP1_001770 [Malassezia sp. CBS 17886]|nr:hypothetical protein MSPP1_001770 [Malassezia sp. CBS 17886]
MSAAPQSSRSHSLRDYYGIEPKDADGGVARSADAEHDGVRHAHAPDAGAGDGASPPPATEHASAAAAESQHSTHAHDTDAEAPMLPAERAAREPLDALLGNAIALLDEIRELNSDRQSLVYNHHQELVSASETVGNMRSGIDALGPEREKIQRLLASVDEERAKLALSADEADEEEIQWTRVVAPIVRLPATLRHADAAEARTLWDAYRPALHAWVAAGVRGANELREACEEVMHDKRREGGDKGGAGGPEQEAERLDGDRREGGRREEGAAEVGES